MPQLEALEERRMVDVRYARFNIALLASLYYNAKRGEDSDPVEVWDFIPGMQRDAEEKEADKLRASTKHGILVALSSMKGSTIAEIRAVALGMVQRLKDNGTEGAEELVSSAFEQIIKEPLEEQCTSR
ncbi:MAG TPA: hypothetical protein VFB43_17890 [Terracidiphilus sp.]|nr:hypothetical protein [Terracidiphilus sp.]